MTFRLNRRHLLKGASSLLGVATLGGFASRNA
jgi:methyl acetate hydrolase